MKSVDNYVEHKVYVDWIIHCIQGSYSFRTPVRHFPGSFWSWLIDWAWFNVCTNTI